MRTILFDIPCGGCERIKKIFNIHLATTHATHPGRDAAASTPGAPGAPARRGAPVHHYDHYHDYDHDHDRWTHDGSPHGVLRMRLRRLDLRGSAPTGGHVVCLLPASETVPRLCEGAPLPARPPSRGDALRAATGASLRAAAGASLHAATGASLHAATGASLHAAAGASLRGATGASLRGATLQRLVSLWRIPLSLFPDAPSHRTCDRVKKKTWLDQPCC